MKTTIEFMFSLSIVQGFLALLTGLSGSLRSRKIRNSYYKFIGYFFVIAILSYTIISATIASTVLLLFLLLLGPIFGPILLVSFFSMALLSLAILWIIGHFPSSLFTGSLVILQPFFSATQISYLLASLLIPQTCDEFVLDGIDVMLWKNKAGRGNTANPIRERYAKTTYTKMILLLCCNFIFAMMIRFVVMMSVGHNNSTAPLVNNVVSSFIAGSQLASVYTVRIRNMKFTSHMQWCCLNGFRIIGFSLPLQLLQSHEGMWSRFVSFLWLGLTYSSSAKLVEPLVSQDLFLMGGDKKHR